MIFYARHKSNNKIYSYNSEEYSDINWWFEGRGIDDIADCFILEEERPTEPKYLEEYKCFDCTSAGRFVSVDYVDGYMDHALTIHEQKKESSEK